MKLKFVPAFVVAVLLVVAVVLLSPRPGFSGPAPEPSSSQTAAPASPGGIETAFPQLSPSPKEEDEEPKGGGGKGPQALVDSSGNARVVFSESQPSKMQGKVDLALQLKQGLGVLTSSLALPPDARSAQGAAYVEANSKHVLAVGAFSGTRGEASPSPGAPKDDTKLNVNLTVKQDGSTATVSGKLDGDMPQGPKPMTVKTITLDGSSSGTYKQGQAKLHLVVQGPGLQASVPFKTLTVKIAEAQSNTQVDASVSVPGKSPTAGDIKKLEGNPAPAEDAIRKQLQKAALKVESVKISNIRATADEAGLDLSIKINDLHATVRTLLPAILANKESPLDPTAMGNALGMLLDIELTKVDVTARSDKDTLDVTIDSSANNLDRFMEGLCEVLAQFYDSYDKMMARRHSFKPPEILLMRAGSVRFRQLKAAWELAAASSDKAQGKLQGSLTADQGRTKLSLSLDGSSDVKALVEAAKKTNLAMAEQQYILLKASLDGKTASGQIFADITGNLFDATKATYAQAAKATPGMEQYEPIISQLQFNDGKLQLTVKDGKLDGSGYLELSDLTPAVKEVLKSKAPSFTGDVPAFDLSMDSPAGGTGVATVSLFLTGVPAKSEADVQSSLKDLAEGQPLAVKLNADAKEVAAPAPAKPGVAMPGELQALVDAARKELGLGTPLGPLGGPGEQKTQIWILIAGVALVVIMGVAVAMKGKKA